MITTTYKTKSGGLYEVQDREDALYVRRAEGGAHYTGKLADGQWHVVAATIDGGVGTSLGICFDDGTMTTTSPITEIVEAGA